MNALSVTAQAGLLGAAAAGVTLYGSGDPAMTDRTRIVTAGMATIFGVASALSGFKVWAGINVGVVAGTLGGMVLAHAGRADANAGAASLRRVP
jgi:hypothetical protein